MIALLVMTDGRPHIFDTIASLREMVSGPISERWIHDDSGDPMHTSVLRAAFPDFQVVATPGRSGFAGAIRSAWQLLREQSSAPYVFHLEDDFTFRRPVDLGEMLYVLDRHPDLLQLALRRQPWNEEERAAGGIVELHPEAYTERTDEASGLSWLEQRLFFTTNPSVYRRRLVVYEEWPSGANSEGRFSHELMNDPEIRFGFFGARDSGEWVHHIGLERVGTGY